MLGTLVGQLGIALGITVWRCCTLNLHIHQLATIAAQLTNQMIDGLDIDGIIGELGGTDFKGQLQVAGCLCS